MTPFNILAALMLSFVVKQGQVAQLLLEVTEFDTTAEKIITEFDILNNIPMNASTLLEIRRVRLRTANLVDLNEKFVSKLTQPYLPTDKLLAPWLSLLQKILMGGGELKESEVMGFSMQILSDKSIKKLLDMDVNELQSEWKDMDLLQRIKDCNEELDGIKAGMAYDETINEF
ncbi:unnamed protein product [Orchesella dallaii]|uniref:Uncharacterized protein n=1 Tax=Orchesella dallaii TaxID=48710 RepID=A0ABP1R2H0_9HEXA